MCGRNNQERGWNHVIDPMATETPSGNRRPPQLNLTVAGRHTNTHHERDRNSAGADAGQAQEVSAVRTALAGAAAAQTTSVAYDIHDGNNFQLVRDAAHDPTTTGSIEEQMKLREVQVLAIVERKGGTSISTVSTHASTVVPNDPDPFDHLSPRIEQALAVYGCGRWADDNQNRSDEYEEEV